VKIADMVGVDVPLHKAGIVLFSGLYGRDFTKDNDLLPALELEKLGDEEWQDLCLNGYV